VKSQFVTSRKKDFFAGQEGGRRYLPYAFTEQAKKTIYVVDDYMNAKSLQHLSQKADGVETELVYHCGASSKDAGKKLCAINQITETANDCMDFAVE